MYIDYKMRKEVLKLGRYIKQYEWIKRICASIIVWFKNRVNKQNTKSRLWQDKWEQAGRKEYYADKIGK